MSQLRKRVFVTSVDCVRQRLQRSFKYSHCDEDIEKRLDDTEAESQAAGYSAVVGGSLICLCGSRMVQIAVIVRSIRAGRWI